MARVKRKRVAHDPRKVAAASSRRLRLYRDERECRGIVGELRDCARDLRKIARRLRGKKMGGARVGAMAAHTTQALAMTADDIHALSRALNRELRRIEREE